MAGRLKKGGHQKSQKEFDREKSEQEILERSKWGFVQVFVEKLSLADEGRDGYKEINHKHISNERLTKIFGKRDDRDWRLTNPIDELTPEEAVSIKELYKKLYCMETMNDQYPDVFMRCWVADRDNDVVNWARYAWHANAEQMKRRTKPPRGKLVSGASSPSYLSYGQSEEDDMDNEPGVNWPPKYTPLQEGRVESTMRKIEGALTALSPEVIQLESKKVRLEERFSLAKGALTDRESRKALTEKQLSALLSRKQQLLDVINGKETRTCGGELTPDQAAHDLKRVGKAAEFQSFVVRNECSMVADGEAEF